MDPSWLLRFLHAVSTLNGPLLNRSRPFSRFLLSSFGCGTVVGGPLATRLFFFFLTPRTPGKQRGGVQTPPRLRHSGSHTPLINNNLESGQLFYFIRLSFFPFRCSSLLPPLGSVSSCLSDRGEPFQKKPFGNVWIFFLFPKTPGSHVLRAR